MRPRPGTDAQNFVITGPQSFQHVVHVSIDSELGFENMREWMEKQLAKSWIRKGDIVEHPKEALDALNFLSRQNENAQGKPAAVAPTLRASAHPQAPVSPPTLASAPRVSGLAFEPIRPREIIADLEQVGRSWR
jgi:hypothetical protein